MNEHLILECQGNFASKVSDKSYLRKCYECKNVICQVCKKDKK